MKGYYLRKGGLGFPFRETSFLSPPARSLSPLSPSYSSRRFCRPISRPSGHPRPRNRSLFLPHLLLFIPIPIDFHDLNRGRRNHDWKKSPKNTSGCLTRRRRFRPNWPRPPTGLWSPCSREPSATGIEANRHRRTVNRTEEIRRPASFRGNFRPLPVGIRLRHRYENCC